MIAQLSIKESIEFLLQREINDSDKLSVANVEQAEAHLQCKLPTALKDLYLFCGNNKSLLSSFNQFKPLNELTLEGSHLIFAEENQGVCWWGINLDDEKFIVYQQNDPYGKWYSEELEIKDFINLMLFYQCCQGYYQHCGYVCLDGDELDKKLKEDWILIANHNGLVIYSNKSCLIWYLEGEDNFDIYFSALTESDFEKNTELYDLAEL